MIALRRIADNWLWLLVPLVLIPLICLRLDFGARITDLFHEGEYLASDVSVRHAAQYGFPVLVHGLLNFLPFEWATQLWGADRAFAGTRAINAALVMTSMVGFTACVAALVHGRRDLRPVAGIAVAALFVLVNGRVPNQVYLHQGAPGIRDLVLFPELFLLIVASRMPHARIALAAQFGAGLLAAVGLFWAYNRGLIGIGLLSTHMAVRAVLRRSPAGTLAAAIGLAAGLAAFWLADPRAFAGHLHNIAYWATHGSLWQLRGGLLGRLIFYGLSGGLMALVCLLLLRTPLTAGWLEIAGVLLVQMLAFVQVAHGRADGVHYAFGLPAIVLLGLFALRIRPPLWLQRGAGARFAAALALLLLVLDLNAPASALRLSAMQAAANLRRVAAALPRNTDLLGPREQIAGRVLKDARGCTYALEGSGVLYALAGRPACSRFLYPSYVGPDGEAGVIADLARARPAIVVAASRHWSMFLDKRTPTQRAPRLVGWINAHYPYEQRVGDFVLRGTKPFAVPPTALRAADADTALYGPYDPQAPALH
jgi:hypothetical protein